ncbi:unnamed protein product [Amoebophrya sp. A25]|nr:unnamed protein product [Amoebophrya sp. A25]|eukprot:GSA25T00019103001.1
MMVMNCDDPAFFSAVFCVDSQLTSHLRAASVGEENEFIRGANEGSEDTSELRVMLSRTKEESPPSRREGAGSRRIFRTTRWRTKLSTTVFTQVVHEWYQLYGSARRVLLSPEITFEDTSTSSFISAPASSNNASSPSISTLEELLKFRKTAKDDCMEGFIITFESGRMAKLKTEKYLHCHSYRTARAGNLFSALNILKAKLSGSLDDLVAEAALRDSTGQKKMMADDDEGGSRGDEQVVGDDGEVMLA